MNKNDFGMLWWSVGMLTSWIYWLVQPTYPVASIFLLVLVSMATGVLIRTTSKEAN